MVHFTVWENIKESQWDYRTYRIRTRGLQRSWVGRFLLPCTHSRFTFYTSPLLVMQSSSEASEEAMGSDPESRGRPLFHPEVEIHAVLGLWDSDSVALLHHSASFPQITIQTTWATADCGENTQTRSSAWPMPAVVFISFTSRHDHYRLNRVYKQVSKGNLLQVSVTISLFQLAI